MTKAPAREVLFIAHRIPFPPDRGDKIRSYNLLRRIASLAPVHVACLAENGADLVHEAELAALSQSHCLVRRRTPLPLALAAALATGQPVSLTAFASARLGRWVRQLLADRPIAAIYVFSGQMAQYVPADFAGRVVMDFVDIDSAKFGAYAASSGPPRSWLYAREERLLARYEERVAHRADISLFVSAAEAALFRTRLTNPAGARVAALGNGIDAALFDPAPFDPGSFAEASAGGAADEGGRIVFTGQMDYPPNIAAVAFFAREVMPLIRAVRPAARFVIVGRAPVAEVRALDGVLGTEVTGEVADVRPWLAGADLVAAPLTIARGVQNKVLEAMAMARPVLLTPEAATGIGASDGDHFAIATGADAMAARALALLSDPAGAAAMGAAARRFVLETSGWDAVLAPLGDLLGLTDDHA